MVWSEWFQCWILNLTFIWFSLLRTILFLSTTTINRHKRQETVTFKIYLSVYQLYIARVFPMKPYFSYLSSKYLKEAILKWRERSKLLLWFLSLYSDHKLRINNKMWLYINWNKTQMYVHRDTFSNFSIYVQNIF